MKNLASLVKILILFLFSSGQVLAWNSSNNPENFGIKLDYDFFNLPLKANIVSNTEMWPGYFWPHNKGSINYRWTRSDQNWDNFRPSLKKLKTLSQLEINTLSPAEKFDISQDRYDYPVSKLASKLSNSRASDWNGICHGLAAASLNHSEPLGKTIKNKNGVEVSFFSSDIKAILSFQYAKNQSVNVRQIGKRCFFKKGTPLVWRHNSCTDTNPGSFHLILGNLIGHGNRGFLADLDRYKEVWNYGINGYESIITKQLKNTIYLKTTIFYSKIIEPQYGNLLGTSFDFQGSRTFNYKLYLNDKNEIKGGNWLNGERPDFIWVQEKLSYSGLFSGLKLLTL